MAFQGENGVRGKTATGAPRGGLGRTLAYGELPPSTESLMRGWTFKLLMASERDYTTIRLRIN